MLFVMRTKQFVSFVPWQRRTSIDTKATLRDDGGDSHPGGTDEPKKIVGGGSFSKFRSGPCADWNRARAGTNAKNSLSEHGTTRSVPHGRSRCRDCLGSKPGTGCDIRRCKNSGPRAPWLRNCRRGEERICVSCGAGLDVPSDGREFWSPKIR